MPCSVLVTEQNDEEEEQAEREEEQAESEIQLYYEQAEEIEREYA